MVRLPDAFVTPRGARDALSHWRPLEPAPFAVESQVSIVSRWDLDVVDTDALLAAGRAAHQRNRAEETGQDTAFTISDTSATLYAITHEAGDPST